MSGSMEKALAILEYLAARPHGASLVSIATDLNQIRSGCHRTLNELMKYGYVRPLPQRGEYVLTTKLSSMGMSFLSKSGIIDIAQPVLNKLAKATEELVRLAILDGGRLTLVAKAEGPKAGLLYDPDMGIDLKLSCSAAGHAWLATLTDQQATEAVVHQGLGDPANYGPNAPVTVKALLKMLQEHRKRGFSMIQEVYAPRMNSMAAVVRRRGEPATGALIIAGPSSRFTEERMLHFGPSVIRMANELALIGSASPLLKPDNLGTWGNKA
jgi:IclR family transcriptional regulator, acetate operon repressor